MFQSVTPELIASAIAGLVFLMSGIGIYAKTKAPKIEGAFKVESEWAEVARQLERIAQAGEDLVAAQKDSFQRDMRDRFERLEEVMEHWQEERRRER